MQEGIFVKPEVQWKVIEETKPMKDLNDGKD